MTNIEYDLKEILTRIEGRFDKLESKVDKIGEDVNDFKIKMTEDIGGLKTDLIRVETTLKSEIEVLSGNVDNIVKRIDTQEFINRGVIIGLILAVLGGFAKVFGLTN